MAGHMVGVGGICSDVLCIESERGALLIFDILVAKAKAGRFTVETEDCCKWIGVFCNNLTGHVTQLYLAATSFSAPDDDAPFTQWEAYEQSKLGGTINPSLL
ncbi:hypothetical protein V6N13_090606 [Hibiscus sabdariffa]|uniref:Leucine-rich repeat-containing N-terminal plant-type domain-containing protein n=1 Tax=Hibiscus sabdariffa TaxID=183260 RepID=A0ABR2AL10_9ROSI